jgi:hypothetical protein
MHDTVVPPAEVTRRTIRRTDWVPCKSAFIDCRTPGSDRKDNYSFIGAGVSQNAEQFVRVSTAASTATSSPCRHGSSAGSPTWGRTTASC